MIATHLSDNELADFVSGRLPADRFEHLMQHLDDCERCQQRASTSVTDDSLAGVLAAGANESHDPLLTEDDCQAALFHAAGATGMRIDRVLPPIETLGPYRLIRPLGRGGMGAVYLAEHGRLRKRVAIKLLPRQHGFDATWIGRFEREMQAIASLSHPGIVTATDAGDVDGWHYLVMEYLDGLDLAAIIDRIGPIAPGVAAALMRDVCDALTSVHHADLIHRDIKPSNIMLTRDGSVKLLDLGLVLDQRESIADLRLTTVGHVIGTLAFAAPEQLSDGSTVDARADMYAVGVTLFQLVTGRTPHSTEHGIAPLVIEKTSKPAVSLRSLAPHAPAELDKLVGELLERDPANRPSRADDVARRLDAMATDGKLKSVVSKAMRVPGPDSFPDSFPSAAVGQSVLHPPKPPHRRGWKWLAAAGIPIGIVALATVIVIQMGDQTVRIETDDPDIKIAVQDSKAAPTGGSATRVAEESPLELLATPPQKIYKGKSLQEWCELMLVERDVPTLGDAMMAVGSLADVEDVTAIQSILIAARRFGGWTASSDPSKPSQLFMSILVERAAPLFMPRPGLDAIANELAEGNENSRAAAIWLLVNLDGSVPPQLPIWAVEPGNRELAERLHKNLTDLLGSGELENKMSREHAKRLSLELAIALDTPLEDEPGLREDLQQLILEAESPISAAERLEQRWSTGVDPVTTPAMTSQQFEAATRLGIELPTSLAAALVTSLDPEFREERNKIYAAKLEAEPQESSDALLFYLLWGHATNPYGGGFGGGMGGGISQGVQSKIGGNQEFWIDVLPIVTKHTTRPDMMQFLMYQVLPSSNDTNGMGGMGHDSSYQPSAPLTEQIEASIKRSNERMEAESIPASIPAASPSVSEGGMF